MGHLSLAERLSSSRRFCFKPIRNFLKTKITLEVLCIIIIPVCPFTHPSIQSSIPLLEYAYIYMPIYQSQCLESWWHNRYRCTGNFKYKMIPATYSPHSARATVHVQLCCTWSETHKAFHECYYAKLNDRNTTLNNQPLLSSFMLCCSRMPERLTKQIYSP